MTEQHPITAPPELVQQWADMLSSRSDHAVFSLAARWGADIELEACVEWVANNISAPEAAELRAAMRPKPPSDKELALKALASIERTADAPVPTNKESLSLIRRALEALPE